MWWLIPILAVFYVIAIILKLAFREQLKDYSSFGLTLRLFFLLTGLGIIVFILAFIFT
jgi:hypothetical protein